jgi:hypothetical protein
MFRHGARYRWRDERYAVVTVDSAGELIMPSGQLTACDPFIGLEFPDEAAPFTVTVPPGRYPVEMCLVGWTEPGKPDEPVSPTRTAAAKLLISRAPAVRWELALVGRQSVDDLADDRFYGYGVDAGTGCFVDTFAIPALKELVDEPDDRPGDNRLTDALEAVDWVGAVNVANTDGTANIIAFMSGPGDGVYPTWIGYAADGQPACFVTEFEFLRHAQPATP